ncbi:MAG: DHHA1 domain-containing protein [Frisingicoccus sp.]
MRKWIIMAYAAWSGGGLESPTIVGAQVAMNFLNITGIKASFVFTRVKETIYVSARSMEGEDGINVQLVMERIGGGGHSTIAGAQLQNMTEAQGMDLVKRTIAKMQKEGAI